MDPTFIETVTAAGADPARVWCKGCRVVDTDRGEISIEAPGGPISYVLKPLSEFL